MTIEKRLTLTG